MTIINIRGTSGSGKSTLVHRFLSENLFEPIYGRFSDWKKDKIVGYKVVGPVVEYNSIEDPVQTFIVGSYASKCGGCDSMSYKGSHDDMEAMIMEHAKDGNVIFEGLTVSSTITRWLRVSAAYPGQMVWAFMDTPEEVCHQRILERNGGREPKRDNRGLADYNRKHRGCVVQRQKLLDMGETVIDLSSDDAGYQKLLSALYVQ